MVVSSIVRTPSARGEFTGTGNAGLIIPVACSWIHTSSAAGEFTGSIVGVGTTHTGCRAGSGVRALVVACTGIGTAEVLARTIVDGGRINCIVVVGVGLGTTRAAGVLAGAIVDGGGVIVVAST